VSERWVIDASVGLAWVHPAQATKETDVLLRQLKQGVTLVVPGLWFQEMANALLVLERTKKLKADERIEALAVLRAFHTKPDYEGAGQAFGRLSELAGQHGLSVYDATYLELALRIQAPLGTKDEPLQKAAQQCGVRLLLK
jgi:predicted nucleic acid-binding protein